MIDSQMEKVRFGQKKVQSKKADIGVPFVMTYHPKLRAVGQFMKKLQHLYSHIGPKKWPTRKKFVT